MNTDVVPIRIDKATLNKIDEVVKSGMFKSRNEALNIILKMGIKNFNVWSDTLSKSNNYNEDYDIEVSKKLGNALNKFLMERDRF
jgi:hypothetical protein